VTVIDTAGIRETDDPVEQEGVRRARARAAEADLVLWLSDAELSEIPYHGSTPIWLVRNKVDLDSSVPGVREDQFRISAARGDGIADLVAALVGFVCEYFGATESSLIGRERQRKLLEEAAISLRRSIEAVGGGEELVAEELRRAALALGRLLGRVDVEDILDVIFREFCIGK
jgi:tRNA modification GTPase